MAWLTTGKLLLQKSSPLPFPQAPFLIRAEERQFQIYGTNSLTSGSDKHTATQEHQVSLIHEKQFPQKYVFKSNGRESHSHNHLKGQNNSEKYSYLSVISGST